MSGSGGGSFGGSPIDGLQCKDVNIITNIATPNPEVLDSIEIGDYLDIVLRGTTGPIVAVTNAGDVVGSILTMDISQLINCISDGFRYHGKVLSKDGGDCRILITAK